MKVEKLEDLDIEFVKYSIGSHQITFSMGQSFFKLFEKSSLQKGNLRATIAFEKKQLSLNFKINIIGNVNVDCDRCLKNISIPIETDFVLLVKITISPEEEDENIAYILPSEHKFNIAKYLYEIIHLSVPMRNVCDDVGEHCDSEVVQRLSAEEQSADEEEVRHPEFEKLKDILKDLK
jgi:uncharacterized protein